MYTITEAAARSGVSVQTLRAWERRYGVVEPRRTPAGYRLYSDAEIARLREMRSLIEQGWRPRQAAARVAEASAGNEIDGLSPAPMLAPPTSPLAAAFVGAARDLHLAEVERILDEALSRASFEEAVDSVIAPALRGVGQEWASGRLDAGAEHAASLAVLRRFSAIFEAAGRPDAPTDVVVGLPPGSRHELGSLSFAITARRIGLGTVYLGPDVPIASWLSAADRTAARVLAIGVPTKRDVDGARGVITSARASGSHFQVVLGGPFAHALAHLPEIRVVADGLAEAAKVAQELADAKRE